MGYLMRYITTDERAVTLAIIEAAFREIDSAYAIANVDVDDLGDLMYGDLRCAIIEINRPGEDIFEDDLSAFREMVQGADAVEQLVRTVLTTPQAMIVLEVFWEGEDAEAILAKIDPLWDWLFDNYEGLSQADNEGFYDRSGLILERNYTI